MKKESKLILIITMIVAVLAAVATIGYALTYKADVAMAEQSTANALWSVAYWVVFIFVVCSFLGIVVFLIKEAIEKKSRFLIILGITIVAFVVSYFLASATDIPQTAFEKAGTSYSEAKSKLLGAACYTVYLLGAGVLGSVLYSEVSKLLK